ncbi:hypothetical protein GCM10022254_43230 [Actinomadura meridiana]|uniref:Uncharacterized protein n=1 Tax=Actinomadura meridiana TaxID=559626 RepID=A0ABP8C8L3_9ACTN
MSWQGTWTHPEAWQCVVSVFPTDGDRARLADAAQINFPATQIEEVAALLGGRRQSHEPV